MRISCIIPAYNEEKTIKNVVGAVRSSGIFDEIIVINDGSDDSTAKILLQEQEIIFINLPENMGKGGAVWHGLQQATGEIIAMLDADLVGLRKHHFEKLLSPILEGQHKVSVGIIRHEDKKFRSWIQEKMPGLSGQQAFYKELIENADIKDSKFGLEVSLIDHFEKKGIATKRMFLEGVTHVIKEEKIGPITGFFARLKMYIEILIALITLRKLRKRNDNTTL